MSRSHWSVLFSASAVFTLAMLPSLGHAEDPALANVPTSLPATTAVASTATATADAAAPLPSVDCQAACGGCQTACATSQPACNAACQAAMPNCCPSNCCRPCHMWFVDVEAAFLAPIQNTKQATFGVDNIASPTGGPLQYSADDSKVDDFAMTPRLTFGLQGESWGIQARYWRMKEWNSDRQIDDFALGGGPLTEGLFKADTVDVEGTKLFCLGESEFKASFGLRYAELVQDARVSYSSPVDLVNSTVYNGFADSRSEIYGLGLTSALTGLTPIGCHNFNLFYNFRGSILWDSDARNSTEAYAAFANNLGHGSAYDYSVAQGCSTLWIGEVQVGGQWNFCLRCVPANAFLRIAAEYQHWEVNNGGVADSVAGGAILHGPVFEAARASAGDARVDLVGVTVATGLTW
jgi:hypothetical protein